MPEVNTKHPAYIVRPFADGDHAFCMTWDKIAEFEESRNTSCFATMRAMLSTRTSPASVNRDVIRLALIGGGTEPAKALALVRRYVEDRPISESFDLAAEILEAAMYGSPAWQQSPDGLASKERQAKMAAATAAELGIVANA